jgi:hypothetical protein
VKHQQVSLALLFHGGITMNLANYDALTARAFDGLDASSDECDVALHNQRMEQVSRTAAAFGRVLLHLGVPALGMLALWLNT